MKAPVFNSACLAVVSLSVATCASATPGNGVGQIAHMSCSFYAGSSKILEDAKCKIWKDDKGSLNLVEDNKMAYRFRIVPVAKSKWEAVYWTGERSLKNQDLVFLGKAEILEERVGKATCWQSIPRAEVPFTLCVE
jgi:hypothetical protein